MLNRCNHEPPQFDRAECEDRPIAPPPGRTHVKHLHKLIMILQRSGSRTLLCCDLPMIGGKDNEQYLGVLAVDNLSKKNLLKSMAERG